MQGLKASTFTLRRRCPLGSKADVCGAKPNVRFTPDSDRKSRHAVNGHVRFASESGHVQCTSPMSAKGQKRTQRAWFEMEEAANPKRPRKTKKFHSTRKFDGSSTASCGMLRTCRLG